MDARQTFLAAYDALLARWPVPVESRDVATPYGRTRVQVCGPVDAPPVVLLHGGGATSTVWYANAGALAAGHRVYAPDVLGDAGRSEPGERPPRTPADLTGWLDALLDGLGVARARIAGHSYGAWLALAYAVHAPDRVSGLVLLDPTDCFWRLRAAYALRALPVLLRPSEARAAAFLRWETAGVDAGVDADPEPGRLWALGAAAPGGKVVLPKRPAPDALRALDVPVHVLPAGRSRAIDPDRVAVAARAALPDVRVTTLPGVSHHTLPFTGADAVNRALVSG